MESKEYSNNLLRLAIDRRKREIEKDFEKRQKFSETFKIFVETIINILDDDRIFAPMKDPRGKKRLGDMVENMSTNDKEVLGEEFHFEYRGMSFRFGFTFPEGQEPYANFTNFDYYGTSRDDMGVFFKEFLSEMAKHNRIKIYD